MLNRCKFCGTIIPEYTELCDLCFILEKNGRRARRSVGFGGRIRMNKSQRHKRRCSGLCCSTCTNDGCCEQQKKGEINLEVIMEAIKEVEKILKEELEEK